MRLSEATSFKDLTQTRPVSYPMKIRSLVTALCATTVLSVAAFAADPSGTWTYTAAMRPGGNARTSTITLQYKDGALSGSVSGRNGDTPIANATFDKDSGAIAFSVTRTFNDNSFTMKYSGKLDGDTITGTIERPNPDGGDPVKIDWKATRGAAASQ